MSTKEMDDDTFRSYAKSWFAEDAKLDQKIGAVWCAVDKFMEHVQMRLDGGTLRIIIPRISYERSGLDRKAFLREIRRRLDAGELPEEWKGLDLEITLKELTGEVTEDDRE